MFPRRALLGLALALVAAPAVALPATTASAKSSPPTLGQFAKKLAAEAGMKANPGLVGQLNARGPAGMSQSTSPLICNGPQPSGTDPSGDVPALDVTSWGHVCNLGVSGMRLSLRTPVNPRLVDDIELRYDTDDNPSNGYSGADYVVDTYWEPQINDLATLVLRTPSPTRTRLASSPSAAPVCPAASRTRSTSLGRAGRGPRSPGSA